MTTLSLEESKKFSSSVDVLKDFNGRLLVSLMIVQNSDTLSLLPAMYQMVGNDTITNLPITLQGWDLVVAQKSDVPKVFLDRLVDEKNSPIWFDKVGLWNKGLLTAIMEQIKKDRSNLVPFTDEELASLNIRNDDGTGKDPAEVVGSGSIEYYVVEIQASRAGRVMTFGATPCSRS